MAAAVADQEAREAKRRALASNRIVASMDGWVERNAVRRARHRLQQKSLGVMQAAIKGWATRAGWTEVEIAAEKTPRGTMELFGLLDSDGTGSVAMRLLICAHGGDDEGMLSSFIDVAEGGHLSAATWQDGVKRVSWRYGAQLAQGLVKHLVFCVRSAKQATKDGEPPAPVPRADGSARLSKEERRRAEKVRGRA